MKKMLLSIAAVLGWIYLASAISPDDSRMTKSFYLKSDVPLTANPNSKEWESVQGVTAERGPRGDLMPGHKTEIRSRWRRQQSLPSFYLSTSSNCIRNQTRQPQRKPPASGIRMLRKSSSDPIFCAPRPEDSPRGPKFTWKKPSLNRAFAEREPTGRRLAGLKPAVTGWPTPISRPKRRLPASASAGPSMPLFRSV